MRPRTSLHSVYVYIIYFIFLIGNFPEIIGTNSEIFTNTAYSRIIKEIRVWRERVILDPHTSNIHLINFNLTSNQHASNSNAFEIWEVTDYQNNCNKFKQLLWFDILIILAPLFFIIERRLYLPSILAICFVASYTSFEVDRPLFNIFLKYKKNLVF